MPTEEYRDMEGGKAADMDGTEAGKVEIGLTIMATRKAGPKDFPMATTIPIIMAA